MSDVAGLRVGFLSVLQRYEMYLADEAYARRGHPGPARLRPSRLGPDIAALRGQVDVCVVLVHWERMYRDVTPTQERLAREIAAAGPDLVVGHHPHVAPGPTPSGLVAVVDVEPNRVVGLGLTLLDADNMARTTSHARPRGPRPTRR